MTSSSSASSSSSSSSSEMLDNPFLLLGIRPVPPRGLMYLDLSNKKLGQTEASAVARFLKDSETFPHLRALQISDKNLPRSGSEAIAAGLLANTTLHTLLITQANDNTSDGIVAILDALSRTHRIASLHLQQAWFETDAFQALHTALKTNPRITSLVLAGCYSHDRRNNIYDFMGVPYLQSLTINGLSFNDSPHEADLAFRRLDTNTTLKSLVLNQCCLADCHAIALAQVFSSGNTSLTELSTSSHKIGPVGVRHLVDALATNSSLTALNLGFCGTLNDIDGHSQASWIHFERLLTCNTTLQSVDVSNHQFNRPGQTIHLGSTFTMPPQLTTLNVSRNYFDDSTMQRLFKALPEGLTTLDLTGCLPIREGVCDPTIFMENIVGLLSHHTALTELSFGDRALQDIPLSTVLKNNTLLRSLKISDVNVRAEGIEELCKALVENSTLETFKFTRVGRHYETDEILARITGIFETYLPFNGSLTYILFDNSYKSVSIPEILERNRRNMGLKTRMLFPALFSIAIINDLLKVDDGTEYDRNNAKRMRRV